MNQDTMKNQAQEQQSSSSPVRFLEVWSAFWDLFFILGSAALLVGIIVLDSSFWGLKLVRIFLGAVLTFFAPGYSLTLVLFARRGDMDIPMRLAFSFGISAALMPLLMFIISELSLGIRPGPILQIVLLWVLVNSFGGIVRRVFLLQKGVAYVPPVISAPQWWITFPLWRKISFVFGVFLLVGTVTVGGYLFMKPAITLQITEFYILNTEGKAKAYPRNAVMGEPLEVLMGIVNREGKTQTYRVEIRVEDSLNPERRALVKVLGPFTLADGEKKEMLVSWSMPWAGKDQKVEFVLFMAGKSQPYRTLHFWLDQVAEADDQ
jgi:uncharacterized membrane protein